MSFLGLETPQPTWPTWPSAKFKNNHDHLIKDEFPFPFLKAFILRHFEKYVVKLQLGKYLLVRNSGNENDFVNFETANPESTY